ncbi:MAG: hypothetical protein ACP5E2_09140 [Terracidiphilus sp.]
MTIQLNPEQERVVGQAIQAGLIRTREDVVEIGIAGIRMRLKASHAHARPQSTDEWLREIAAWSGSHQTGSPLLPDEALDRESIYGERGL